jgi:hypothetical protein
MMSEEAKSQDSKNKLFGLISLSDTLIIVSLPIMANLLLFVYYAGYFAPFELPTQFFAYNFSQVFQVTAGLLVIALAFVLIQWANAILGATRRLPKPIIKRAADILPPMLAAYLLVYDFVYDATGMSFTDLCLQVTPPLLTLMGIIGIHKFAPRSTSGTYLEKLEADDRQSEAASKKKLEETADPIRRFPLLRVKFFGPLFWYLSLGLLAVYAFGRTMAWNTDKFYVANTSPEETVVLWIDNSKIICAPFDRNTREVEPSFLILSVPGDPSTIFRLEKIGPLRLKKGAVSRAPIPGLFPTPTVLPTLTPTNTLTPSASPSP